ncbi:MAG: tRNA (N6-isopentenyl adenosine(37)-C2)-methylthiotransferase MiaB, partial [Candidatus Saganbacteria bacterium]|nr:tRNA (N6-isopentenyl adenosine(37)-C2)-methylthiotransferase MiaB [Candidatus Saganbacteria bacterium]
TYGCQMNVADSEKLAAVLEAAGYQVTLDVGQADIVLVNTCVVRKNAEDKAAWHITSAKGLKKENPKVIIGVCGCIVTEPGRDLKKQFPHVDVFIPPHQPEKLVEFLGIVGETVDSGKSTSSRGDSFGPMSFRTRSVRGKIENRKQKKAFVTIMHGCNNFCSYCIVPYVRGREFSRPVDDVLAEIKSLVDSGASEIILLGQNVNSYKYGLAKLLREIGEKTSLMTSARTRATATVGFLTSHPRDMSDEIIEAVYELPYVTKEFVMPLQSGDDEILAKMNRGYTLEHYLGRVAKIRSLMPNARISSDFLVGFPGETEKQFQNTLAAVERIKFDEAHMFAYSSRPETAAAKLPDQLSDEIKRERLQRLISLVKGMLAERE